MDGVHDIGGLEGFGSVAAPAPTEPVFHEDWERRAFRVSMATMLALLPGASFRHSIERMDAAHYLGSSYYEHWLTGVATLLVDAGLTTDAALDERAGGHFPLSRPDRGTPPASPERDRTEHRFKVGDVVRVREWHPLGHTRAPRYVQGKRGVITRADVPQNVPDFEAHGGGHVLDPTYSVRFSPAELWGEGGADGATVNVDLWERYLEADA